MSKVSVRNMRRNILAVPLAGGEVLHIGPQDEKQIDQSEVGDGLKTLESRGRVRLTVVSEKRARGAPKRRRGPTDDDETGNAPTKTSDEANE